MVVERINGEGTGKEKNSPWHTVSAGQSLVIITDAVDSGAGILSEGSPCRVSWADLDFNKL